MAHIFLISTILLPCMWSKTVTISNINPRLDTNGNIIDVHDGNINYYNGTYFYYGMGYGLCEEPINTSNGCASMHNGNQCGFEYNHSVNLYTSKFLDIWEYKGNILPLKTRPYGVYFSPSVVYNPNTNKYILYAHYLLNSSNFMSGLYMAAQSDSPYGPFIGVNDNVNLSNIHPGDSKLFVDSDGSGYLIYASVHNSSFRPTVVEKLTNDYIYSTGEKSNIFNPNGANYHCLEAPSLFKHIINGLYYGFSSYCCCYCGHGGNVMIYMSDNILGPYTMMKPTPYINDINGTGNNNDLIINAQETYILLVNPMNISNYKYIWIGDRWQTSPDGTKAHDFTYWTPLEFTNVSVNIMQWYNNFTIHVDESKTYQM